MKSTKLLTGLLLASTALPFVTSASAETATPAGQASRPFVLAQAASGEIRVRPDVGVTPPSLRSQAGGNDDAERPRRGGAQPGEGPAGQPRGERRQGEPGGAGRAGQAGQAGQGASGADKPDAAQPRRAGSGAGDAEAPR